MIAPLRVAILLLVAVFLFSCSPGWLDGHDPSDPVLITLPTEDGFTLTCRHYAPLQFPALPIAVILLPDVYENANVFDLQGRGLARYLAEKGLDVYALNWRGTGQSKNPSLGNAGKWDWDFDALVSQDLPAIIKVVRQRSKKVIKVVGHGLGGTAALAFAGGNDEKAAEISAIVGIGTPGRPMVPNEIFNALIDDSSKLPANAPVMVPKGATMPAPFPDPTRSVLDILLTNGKDFDAKVRREYYTNCLEPIPFAMAAQFIGWYRNKTMVRGDGSGDYRQAIKSVTTQVHFICGKIDNLVDPVDSIDAFRTLETPKKSFQIFSLANNNEYEFGHVGLLLASSAKKEIYPTIYDVLVNRRQQ